jgi:hypothetical protein
MAQRPPIQKLTDEEWARRRAGNVRLAWTLVGVVAVVFVIAIWKYRPL